MDKRGMDLKSLAEQTGLSVPFLENMLVENVYPPLGPLMKLCAPGSWPGRSGWKGGEVICMKRFVCMALVLFLCSIAVDRSRAQPTQSPGQQLQETVEKVTAILTRLTDDSRKDARKQMRLLCDAVHERFSLAETARLSLAAHWDKRTDTEKTAFIALFGRFLESVYLPWADRYDGEQVVFIREKIANNRALVHVRIHHGMLRIPVTVRMHLTGAGQWMVYDVAAFGVSLVGNLRAQFNHIIKRHSYDTVIWIMEEKTEEYTGCANSSAAIRCCLGKILIKGHMNGFCGAPPLF